MDKPLVSIITPCYNGETFLDRFFESILWQDYMNCEVIFVNDGSTDNTEKIALQYGKQLQRKGYSFVYLVQENAGQAAALQNGLWKAQGKYITWPDSDDQIMPLYVSSKVFFMEENPECAMCYGRVDYVKENEPDVICSSLGKRESENSFFDDCLFHSERVCYNGYFVRTSSVEQVLNNREIVVCRGGQNLQLMLPLGWYFGEPGYVADSVYKYFVRENSHSRDAKLPELQIQKSKEYENICISVIQQIDGERIKEIIRKVKVKFARIKFSYAIDTKNRTILSKYYRELKAVCRPTTKEHLLFLKHYMFSTKPRQ